MKSAIFSLEKPETSATVFPRFGGIIMSHTDYIPTKDSDFDRWFENLKNYVVKMTSSNPPAWTHIPADKVTELCARFDAWHGAFLKTEGPHTTVDTELKNDEKKKSQDFIRPFVSQYLRFDPVTDEDRTAMGVPNHKTTHTPVHVPHGAPELLPDTSTRRQINVFYRPDGSSHRGRPEGVTAIVIRWAKLKEAPKDEAELTNIAVDTNPPLTLSFEEHERGEKVFMCSRWQIHREGEMGPASGIIEAVIP
jgi:hypothetical protein